MLTEAEKQPAIHKTQTQIDIREVHLLYKYEYKPNNGCHKICPFCNNSWIVSDSTKWLGTSIWPDL